MKAFRLWRRTSSALAGFALAVIPGIPGCGDGPSEPTLVSVAVAPDSLVLPAVGARFVLSVSGSRSDGGARDLTADAGTAYTSRNAAVATVAAGGTVRAIAAGATTIVVAHSGLSDSAVAVVDPVSGLAVDSLSIAPEDRIFSALGQMQSTTVVVIWENGARFDGGGSPIAYSTDDDAVATVGADGTIAPVGNGTTTVRASFGGRSDSVEVTVLLGGPVRSVAVDPDSVVMPALNARFQITVTARSDAGDADVTADPATTFTSRDQLVAAIAAGGSLIAIGPGRTDVIATNSGHSDSISVTVEVGAALPVDSISIVPEEIAFDALDEKRATTTTVLWRNGVRFDGSDGPLAYSSDDTSVASVSLFGVVMATGPGSTLVRVTIGGASDSLSVTVAGAPPVSFAAEIQPIFTSNCAGATCHVNPIAGPGHGLRLTSYTNIVLVGATNPPNLIITPGDGAGSRVIRALRGQLQSEGIPQMPKGRAALPAATIATIETWIDEGALDN